MFELINELLNELTEMIGLADAPQAPIDTGSQIQINVAHDNQTGFLVKVSDLFNRIAECDNPDVAMWGVGNDLSRYKNYASSLLDEYENMEEPKGTEQLNSAIIEGFEHYYQGLLEFEAYLMEGDEQAVMRCFNLVSHGDQLLIGVLEEIDKEQNLGFVMY